MAFLPGTFLFVLIDHSLELFYLCGTFRQLSFQPLDFCILFSRYAKRKLLLHRQHLSFFPFQDDPLVAQFIDLDLLLDFRIRLALLQFLILFFQLVPLFCGKLFQGLFFLFQLVGPLFQAFLDHFQALLKFLQVRFLFFLFFFLYCFLGWVWESCYVSAKQHRWVNRGFLHGPLLPIYGFGAVLILWATLPVRQSLPLIFLLGMLAATALEYVTGAAMEALFKVRYWDYSHQPCNLHGYICLTSSLAWGAFSILLVRVLHPPFEDLVLWLPPFLTDALACVLTIYTTADTVRSFQAAMDLREVLTPNGPQGEG